jgi:hypothetical protein
VAHPAAFFTVSNLQKYPFGVVPYVFRAGDVVTPLLFLPFHAVLPLGPAVNGFVLSILVANGMSAWWAARRLGSGTAVACVAGLLFACNPYLAEEVGHGRFVQGLLCTFPAFLVCWERACDGRTRGPWPAVAAAALLAATFLVYPYYGVMLVLLAVPAPLLLGASWGRWAGRALGLCAAVALAVLPALLPVLLAWDDLTRIPLTCQDYAPVVYDLPDTFHATYSHSLWLARRWCRVAHVQEDGPAMHLGKRILGSWIIRGLNRLAGA